MFYLLVNYNSDPSWVKEYASEYFIYDRSDDGRGFDVPEGHSVKRENLGHCDYDKLTYLVENYDNLPEVFYWGKVNLWKSITRDEFNKVKDTQEFMPLLTQNHKTYLPVCFYDHNGMYNEINNSWYLSSYPAKYFKNYGEFAKHFSLPNPEYLAFAPGGNYILTREKVHRYGRDFYDEMRSFLPYCQLPGEAQMVERSLYNMWK